MPGRGCRCDHPVMGHDREDRPADYADHDHSVEDAVILAFTHPTPANQHAAELAVVLLQRRYEYLLRRLDGSTGEPLEYAEHRHNPATDPEHCADAVMHELAGAVLADRAETLAHGLEAVRALARQACEARELAWAAFHGRLADVDLPAWLLADKPPAGFPAITLGAHISAADVADALDDE